MSNKSFRIIADVYPSRINIDATGANSWRNCNKKVIEKLKSINSTFDWSIYNNRKNNPNFLFDNSSSNYSDKEPDYIYVLYRYNRDWSNQPVAGMSNWSGTADGAAGYAAFDGVESITFNDYTFISGTGYIQTDAKTNAYAVFIHETAHTIFDCPHYAWANGVVGNYFYEEHGYGMMNLGGGTFGCANGWERWYLGWIGLQSNEVNSDIKQASDLPADGTLVLRDFVTTGDVVRIKIPNGNGKNQYLWLENHQGKSAFDNRGWIADDCSTFPNSPRGIVAYIESISDDKDNPFDFWGNNFTANGIKFIHSKGNYDCIINDFNDNLKCLWGNSAYNIEELVANPISGQDRLQDITVDLNGDDAIALDVGANNGSSEAHWFAKRNNTMSYDFMGSQSNFKIGSKIGISTNPMLINRPNYFEKTDPPTMSPYFLNGISFEVLDQDDEGNIQLQVRFNDVDINKDTRWTGTSIILNDITGNANPDVNILSNITVTIDKSGTPNRHTKHPITDEFINPTVFTVNSSALFKLQANAKTIIKNNSAFVLESGSTLEISDGATFTVNSGSTLLVKSGANILIHGGGTIDIQAGAYICIASGATLNLQDISSSLNLHNSFIFGLNTDVLTNPGTCANIVSAITITGNGCIHSAYSGDKYIQNIEYYHYLFLPGFVFFAGSNVTTENPPGPGPVIIKSGANVVFDSDNEITLDKGFEVELGGTFEAK